MRCHFMIGHNASPICQIAESFVTERVVCVNEGAEPMDGSACRRWSASGRKVQHHMHLHGEKERKMKLFTKKYQLVFLLGLLTIGQFSLLPRCSAGFDGSATGPTSASDYDSEGIWSSTLDPVPAVLETGQDASVNSWVLNALGAAGFNGTGGWTINTKSLQGSLSIGAYYAWVTTQPALTAGNLTTSGGATGRIGGAAFDLEYTPKGTDPTGTAVDWLQIVHSDNQFASGHSGYNEGNNFYDFVDDFQGENGPTYKANGGTANAYSFLDTPYDVCPGGDYHSTSQFVTAIATEDLTDKTLTIYTTAVEWGYDFGNIPTSPETFSTFVLLCLTAFGLGGCDWRRRMAKA